MRALMAISVSRLLRRRDRPSRAIARALQTTALGRISPHERTWVDRIEARFRHQGNMEAGITPLWGLFLMRLLRELEPRSCLELGTGWGTSGAYQAAALELNEAGFLVTCDIEPEWARAAEREFGELGLHRVELRLGPLNDTLGPQLASMEPVDYAFIDADHEEEAESGYFEAMLPHLSPGAVIVFDDINFNEGMKRVWKAIRGHERVSLAIGLRRMGITVVNV